MIDAPMTLAQAEKRRYGAWAGSPNGSAYDPKCCAAEVCDSGRGALFHQCGRAPGYGPDNLYCRQHEPEAVNKRREASARRYHEQSARERPKWYAVQMLTIIRKIAVGHNDPSALCREFVEKYDNES